MVARCRLRLRTVQKFELNFPCSSFPQVHVQQACVLQFCLLMPLFPWLSAAGLCIPGYLSSVVCSLAGARGQVPRAKVHRARWLGPGGWGYLAKLYAQSYYP